MLSMKTGYFKPRRFFDFSPHPFDIGNPLGAWRKYEDNHFLNKICELEQDKFEVFYNYHLLHTLENNICNEEAFLVKVWEVVEDRIKNLKAKDPYSSYHDRYIFRISKLQQFQKYLNRIDQWNARPSHIVIAEKEELIQKQKEELEKLQIRLAELNEHEVVQKIRIEEHFLPVFADLIRQIRELELPSGRKLLRSDHKSPYYMMISKYFSDGGENIPWETARNQFKGQIDEAQKIGNPNKKGKRLFKIVPVEEPEK